MVKNQVLSSHLNLEPNSPRWMAYQPRSGNHALPVATGVTVYFEAEKCSLNDSEIDKLGNWVKHWNTLNNRTKLSLGGATVSSRSNRLRRLGFLMSLLGKLGVPCQRVQADSEWMRPARMGAIDDLPADAIWLQIR